MISQGGFLYEATLRDNLDPFHLVRKDKIQRVLQKGTDFLIEATRHAPSTSEIKEHAEKLFNEDFFIEKGGKNLSNGEKQIINFLRILLRENDIIVLDEATSNVDPITGIKRK